MIYADGLFPFCIPRYPVWDGETWFETGSGDNYTRTASASSDVFQPVVGPGTSWVLIPVELASELYWRAGALRCRHVSASASLSLELLGQANIGASMVATAPRIMSQVPDAAELMEQAERSLVCSRSSANIWSHGLWTYIAAYGYPTPDGWESTDLSTTPGSASVTGALTGTLAGMSARAELHVGSLTSDYSWFDAHRQEGRLAWGEDGGLYMLWGGQVLEAYITAAAGIPWDSARIVVSIGAGVESESRHLTEYPFNPEWFVGSCGRTVDAQSSVRVSVLGHCLDLPLLLSYGAAGLGPHVTGDGPLPVASFAMSYSVEFDCTDWFTYGGIYDPVTGQRV